MKHFLTALLYFTLTLAALLVTLPLYAVAVFLRGILDSIVLFVGGLMGGLDAIRDRLKATGEKR